MVGHDTPASQGSGSVPPPLGLTLTRSTFGQQMLVHARGDIDLVTAESLDSYLLDTAGQSSGMGVDLTATTFLDSSGVRVLVQAARRATGSGAAFFLLCPAANTAVRRVLDILQLQSVMAIVNASAADWARDLATVAVVDLTGRVAEPSHTPVAD